ncbi:MAG TPA: bifunctional adenosylcobinamide kinase/adenosylcobinamide-phosphate guanylyltransferase [Solirubrobacteraceae bacterium]|nr:bifunctional adenosylcobinamide kinase/adenosylcobinamide-phosphate guanylyltransferase [Solirubrobacteraceae bacterium]
MALCVLLGGARAGKSALALRCARAHGGPVCMIATATAGDAEMAARIARHRSERPREWLTIEEPLALAAALARAPAQALVIIDCLTLWVANLLGSGTDERAIEALAQEAAAAAARRTAPVIAVGNELGMGLVPADPCSRRFRDLHGRVNAIWVARAEQAYLVVAGALIALGRGEEITLASAVDLRAPAPETRR